MIFNAIASTQKNLSKFIMGQYHGPGTHIDPLEIRNPSALTIDLPGILKNNPSLQKLTCGLICKLTTDIVYY
jgi:hypothetical protein